MSTTDWGKKARELYNDILRMVETDELILRERRILSDELILRERRILSIRDTLAAAHREGRAELAGKVRELAAKWRTPVASSLPALEAVYNQCADEVLALLTEKERLPVKCDKHGLGLLHIPSIRRELGE